MKAKKEPTYRVTSFDLDLPVSLTLDELINILTQQKKEFEELSEKTFPGLFNRIEVNAEDGSLELTLFRKETTSEKAKRLIRESKERDKKKKAIKACKEKTEKKELEELARLKKKYPNHS